MKSNKILNVICIILAVLPIILCIFVYGDLPEQVPTHWNFEGEVDGYGNKSTYAFLSGLPLLLHILFSITPKIDPKGKNIEKFKGFYNSFKVFMIIFMDVVFFASLFVILNPETQLIEIGDVVNGMIGIMFIFIGNYMPRAKQNYSFGIKTPWTLASETVWIKTHRISGYTFILSGVLFLANIFLPNEYRGTMFIVAMVIIMLPSVMSYFYYKQEKGKESN